VAWAARPFETAREAVRETSPAVMAHYITRRGPCIVAFWHLLSRRRRLDTAAPRSPPPSQPRRPPELSPPSPQPRPGRLGHRSACQAPGTAGYRLRTLSPLGPPSGASTGRQSTARATQTARPTSALDRAAPTASVAGSGQAGGVRAAPRGGAHRSPLTAPPRPVAPHRTRPSSGAQGGTFNACLGPPRHHARRHDQGGGLGGADEARAARLGAARRPSLARAAHKALAHVPPVAGAAWE